MTELKDRIDKAIARVTASKAADSVLAELRPELDRWERVRRYAAAMMQCEINVSEMPDDRHWNDDAEEAQAAERALQPGDLDSTACRDVGR